MEDWKPLLIGFVCKHCYCGEGDVRRQNHCNLRVIPVSCVGRINAQFVLRAFHRGADAVLVAGCQQGECRYVGASRVNLRRLALMQQLLVFTGIEPERLRVQLFAHADAVGFRDALDEMAETVHLLGPNNRLREAL